jgi:FkbM family methyltransferase
MFLNMNSKNKIKNRLRKEIKKIISNNKEIVEKWTDSYIYFALPRGLNFLYDVSNTFPRYHVDTIFDVGANKGQSSKVYLKDFPDAHIYCFKGNERVYCHQLALGSGKRQATMTMQGSSDMFFLLDQSKESLRNTDTVTESVSLVTIDEFCESNKIDHISYLKIDTEGGDLEVLKGSNAMLSEQKIDLVEVEAGMNPSNERHVPCENLKSFLESHGYFLFGIYKQMYEWPTRKPYLRRSNLLFISQSMMEIK